MRDYMRQRRLLKPERLLIERARKRAKAAKLPFRLAREDITVPDVCPALGIPIELGKGRTNNSPSLDRLNPPLGYVPGNVRVISDRANRLKSDRAIDHLRCLAEKGGPNGEEYQKLVQYLEREQLLAAMKARLSNLGGLIEETSKMLIVLEQVFATGRTA